LERIRKAANLFVFRSRRGDRLKILLWKRDEIEYIPGHFEHIQHVRQKYACPSCEHQGENPQIKVAAKAETAIEKGFAGPGLLSPNPALTSVSA
jgi:transposase